MARQTQDGDRLATSVGADDSETIIDDSELAGIRVVKSKERFRLENLSAYQPRSFRMAAHSSAALASCEEEVLFR